MDAEGEIEGPELWKRVFLCGTELEQVFCSRVSAYVPVCVCVCVHACVCLHVVA
jgi:hypothetical protein